MGKHKLSEIIIDPSSGDYSASRLCLCVLILAYLPVLVALDALGLKVTAWGHMAVIVGSVSGIYGVNTGLRVWKGKVYERNHKEE